MKRNAGRKKRLGRELGATAVEYALLIGLVGLGVLGSTQFLKRGINTTMSKVPNCGSEQLVAGSQTVTFQNGTGEDVEVIQPSAACTTGAAVQTSIVAGGALLRTCNASIGCAQLSIVGKSSGRVYLASTGPLPVPTTIVLSS